MWEAWTSGKIDDMEAHWAWLIVAGSPLVALKADRLQRQHRQIAMRL